MIYNYPRFRASLYALDTFDGPEIGTPMPELVLHTPSGEPVRLSDFRGRTVVLETGSVTCPIYAGRVRSMQDVAARHPDVVFLVVYVREAHPGERLGPHATAEDKRAAAARLAGEVGEGRTVLVDDLDGTVHRTLGGLPDMVYVIDPAGCVVWRRDWNDPADVEAVLDGQPRPVHKQPVKPGPAAALPTLWRGGWLALWDMVRGIPGLLLGHARADRAHGDGASPVLGGGC